MFKYPHSTRSHYYNVYLNLSSVIPATSYRTKKNRKKVITPDDINSLFSEKKAADDEENEEEEEEEEDNQLAGNYHQT